MAEKKLTFNYGTLTGYLLRRTGTRNKEYVGESTIRADLVSRCLSGENTSPKYMRSEENNKKFVHNILSKFLPDENNVELKADIIREILILYQNSISFDLNKFNKLKNKYDTNNFLDFICYSYILAYEEDERIDLQKRDFKVKNPKNLKFDELKEVIDKNNNKNFEQYPDGIVPYDIFINSQERFDNETIASVLINDFIKLKKGSESHIEMDINISNVEEVVISNVGKKKLTEINIAAKENWEIKALYDEDKMTHEHLMDLNKDYDTKIKLPFRWASGGVLSIIKFKDRGPERENEAWIPLFFRDIRPYGWNISLGSSERNFDDLTKTKELFLDELSYPQNYSLREFLEETIILDGSPLENSTLNSRTIILNNDNRNSIKISSYIKDYISLRKTYDQITISPERAHVKATTIPTKMNLNVIREDESKHFPTINIISCINYLELGIEIVTPVTYEISEDSYFLDGEVILKNINGEEHKELARMPVYLFSCDFLKKCFKKLKFDQSLYTLGNQPSIRINEKIPNDKKVVRPFEYDIEQKVRILKREKENENERVGEFEYQRCMDWYDLFGKNFLDEHNKFSAENISQLFTPATAKILSLYFNNVEEHNEIKISGDNP